MRFQRIDADEQEGKADLTGLIDLIFLLLVFLILTTHFVPEEQVIGQLLPTDRGKPHVDIPLVIDDPVRIVVHPEDLQNGRSLQWYENFARQNGVRELQQAVLRIGGERLRVDAGAPVEAELDRVAGFVAAELQRYEQAGTPRTEQDRVEIHCYSGMPWRFALWSYDAVRAYEIERGADFQREPGRAVDFAPSRVRHAELGSRARELRELVLMR